MTLPEGYESGRAEMTDFYIMKLNIEIGVYDDQLEFGCPLNEYQQGQALIIATILHRELLKARSGWEAAQASLRKKNGCGHESSHSPKGKKHGTIGELIEIAESLAPRVSELEGRTKQLESRL